MTGLLAALRRAFTLTECVPLFSAKPTCRCVLVYKFPEGPTGTLNLGAALCADLHTLEAMQCLDVRECSRCQKRGGSPWLEAMRQGGEAAVRQKLVELAAESIADPYPPHGDGHKALVGNRNHQLRPVPGICQQVAEHQPATADGDGQPNPVTAPGHQHPSHAGDRPHQGGSQHQKVDQASVHDSTGEEKDPKHEHRQAQIQPHRQGASGMKTLTVTLSDNLYDQLRLLDAEVRHSTFSDDWAERVESLAPRAIAVLLVAITEQAKAQEAA